MYFNTLIFFPRAVEDIATVDTGAVYRITLVVVAGALAAYAMMARPNAVFALLTTAVAGYVGYGLMGIGSTVYSSAPLYTLWKSLEIVVASTLVALVVTSPKRGALAVHAYELSFLLIIFTTLSVLVGMAFWPEAAWKPISGLLPYSLQGVRPMLNSNTVGSLAAITALGGFVRYKRCARRSSRLGFLLIFAVGVACVLLSTSRTALGALIIGFTVFGVYSKDYKLLVAIAGVAVMLVAVQTVQQLAVEYVRKDQSWESIATLTGRLKGWEAAWEHFKASPYLGHGLAAAGRFGVLGGETSTLHGAIFDVLVGVGAVGTAFWLVALVVPGIKLLWPRAGGSLDPGERLGRAELAAMFSLVMARTATSSGLAFHDRETMLYMGLLAVVVVGRGALRTLGGGAASGERRPSEPSKGRHPRMAADGVILRRDAG